MFEILGFEFCKLIMVEYFLFYLFKICLYSIYIFLYKYLRVKSILHVWHAIFWSSSS